MQWIPCNDESNKSKRFYCCFDSQCFEMLKDDAKCVETYDARDGTTCDILVSECPC